MIRQKQRFKTRQKLGKYRLVRRLAEGGFAEVYEADDTIEGIRVALKIPHDRLIGPTSLADFRKEVRLVAGLDHPNILPVKTADYIEGHFIIVYALGLESLAERLSRRIASRTALHYVEQILRALAYAHSQRVIHCDVKPENCILFSGNVVRLSDFGIARIAVRTALSGSGGGTLGYIAPEQAMGKLSFASDVFSVGLIFYQLFAGRLPEWPFDWPPPDFTRLKARLSPGMIEVIRRSMEVDARRRFRDAGQMLAAFERQRRRALTPATRTTRKRRTATEPADWKAVRNRTFQRQYGRVLQTKAECPRCASPVAETMTGCPWCGLEFETYQGPSDFPARCVRCGRGQKLDWRFCAWCYGPGRDEIAARDYTDRRYVARCPNRACTRRQIMPFMRYCPWCRTRIRRPWKLAVPAARPCPRCSWSVLPDFWDHCPWCTKKLK